MEVSKNQKSGFFKFDQISESKAEVNHSSALFLLKESKIQDITTNLCFLNYWKIKRNVINLRGHITIRDLEGHDIHEEEIEVIDLKAYKIDLRSVLNSQGIFEFTGLVEIEFFSKVNLFVPYPAVNVVYSGKNWHTCMHSTARYFYEDSGDKKELIRNKQNSTESNITLFSQPEITNEVYIHNGIHEILNEDITLTVTNHLGKKQKTVLTNTEMRPRETLVISIDDHLDYKTFLDGKRGMLTVEYVSQGVFPRIMFLNKTLDGSFSVEHSNFGLSEASLLDCTPTKEEKSLMFSLPLLPIEYITEVDIFPTYPILDSPYSVEIVKEDFEGKHLSKEEIFLNNTAPFLQHSLEPDEKTTNIQIDYRNPDALPNRFHTAINYRYKNTTLPGILLDGPIPKAARPIGTRWCPFFWNNKSINTRIVISSRVYDPSEANNMVKITFQLFGQNKEYLSFDKEIPQRQSFELDIRETLTEHNWLSDYGWIYMNFNPSSLFNVYWLSEKENNSIMCDHAF